MHHGRIVESGDARAVIGAPAHPYTQRLLAAASA
jgi:ABC-type dipeptide/oligopeptide/nickel transport system ATPase component